MPRLLVILLAVTATLSTATIGAADDAQIAQQITAQLRQQQLSQNLQGFRIGVQVDNGTVTMMGQVSSSDQGQLALEIARRVPGVRLVVNDLSVQQPTTIATEPKPRQVRPQAAPAAQQAALSQPTAIAGMPSNYAAQAALTAAAPLPSPAIAAMPPMAPGMLRQPATAPMSAGAPRSAATAIPVAFAPSQLPGQMGASPATAIGYPTGQVAGPIPATMPSQMGSGLQQAMHDNPNMPRHAWPSYAANPNYAAVSYPKQYSPAAWPYIGPFYPYPQVPLGWRKVMLEWDDGWWWLDFKSK